MSKLPKDIIRKIMEAEFLEKFDGKKWVKVPVHSKSPAVQKLKEVMLAEIEINVIIEALELGILLRSDRELN